MSLVRFLTEKHEKAERTETMPSVLRGLTLLAAAPCTASFRLEPPLRWGCQSHAYPGRIERTPYHGLFAFAPSVGLLLRLSAITVPWDTLFLSAVLYTCYRCSSRHDGGACLVRIRSVPARATVVGVLVSAALKRRRLRRSRLGLVGISLDSFTLVGSSFSAQMLHTKRIGHCRIRG